jgi:hypothetical protein
MSQTPEKRREKTPYSQNSPYRNSYSIEKKLQVIKVILKSIMASQVKHLDKQIYTVQ